jgi:hypothetical protein
MPKAEWIEEKEGGTLSFGAIRRVRVHNASTHHYICILRGIALWSDLV